MDSNIYKDAGLIRTIIHNYNGNNIMTKQRYIEFKLYLKDESTKIGLKKLIAEYKNGDECIKAIINTHRTNPDVFRLKFA